MNKTTLHILPNAHIDPVWLWDRREGAAEAISTCRTVVELMRRNPELTFIRGEAWVYEQLERYAPELLEEIRRLVALGRWDIVGGNYIQSDTNLPSTTTFLRQFAVGQDYFQRYFGRKVEAAWSSDSFGQAAGLPDIYAASGFKYYAFGRPEAWIYPLAKPLFFWRGQAGSELLCYRIPIDWYASERHGIPKRLDDYLVKLPEWDLKNVAVFFGLGDHGGGPTQRHIDDLHSWARQHPEVEVRFSTLHAFFAAAEAEISQRGRELLPIVDSEINFLQRGYYGGGAKTKFAFRTAEAALRRANTFNNLAALRRKIAPPATETLWKDLLFNAFHDILPGTSIERASEQQHHHLSMVIHQSNEIEHHALASLVAQIDTTVKNVPYDMSQAVPMIVFNPHPFTYIGQVEMEAALDYRPIWRYENRPDDLPVELLDENSNPIAFQFLPTEHRCFNTLPWRKRVIFKTEIPPLGWRRFTLGYVEKPLTAQLPADQPITGITPDGGIKSPDCRVEAVVGGDRIRLFYHDRELFGGAGLQLVTTADAWGPWGCLKEQPEAFMCTQKLETWRIKAVQPLESGPERSSLRVLFAGANSWVEIIVRLSRERCAIDFDLRILWNEVSTRLRLVTMAADRVVYEVPGGEASRSRQVLGDVPGGRRLIWHSHSEPAVGIVNDKLCGFGNYEDCFGITLIRGNRYCTDLIEGPDDSPEHPAADLGEHRCKIIIVPEAAATKQISAELEQPPVVVMADRHPGVLPPSASLLRIEPAEVDMLDSRVDADGNLTLILQQLSGHPLDAVITIPGMNRQQIALPHGKIIACNIVVGKK